MPEKSPDEVKELVLGVMDEVPRTVEEIAKLAGTSWPGTKRALENLVKLGTIKATRRGKRVLYYRQTGKTWFGLPIDTKSKEILEYILWTAREVWKMSIGTEPGKTNLQKIAVEVNRTLNLGLPTFKYMYGEITLLKEIPKDPPRRVDIPGLDSTIEKVVIVYSGSARSAKDIQYSREDMKFYRIKQEIEDNWEQYLTSGKLATKLVDLLWASPRDEYIADAIKDFLGTYSLVQSRGDIEKMKYKLWELFQSVWREISLRYAYITLKKMGYSDTDLVTVLERYNEQVNENNALMDEIEGTSEYKIDPNIHKFLGAAKSG